MNYFNYIDSLEPSTSLKGRTENYLIDEINKKNKMVRKNRLAILSSAACFVLLATTVFALKSVNKAPEIFNNTSEVQNVTSNISADEKIKININNVDTKYGAQKIKINNLVYTQYCNKNNKAFWGDDNGDLAIDKEDIGEKICTLNQDNLIDFEHWIDFSTMTKKQAENCKFRGADVFEYKKVAGCTQIIVKQSDEYYMFYLTNITEKTSVEEIFDIFTANDKNQVKELDIFNDTEESKIICKIKNKDTINNILSTLKKSTENLTTKQIVSNGYIEDFNNNHKGYVLNFRFEDNTELNIIVYSKYFSISVSQKSEYGNYNLTKSDYDSIINLIEKAKNN